MFNYVNRNMIISNRHQKFLSDRTVWYLKHPGNSPYRGSFGQNVKKV
jgi:hypothetical protein